VTPVKAFPSSYFEGAVARLRTRATLVLSTIAVIASAAGALWLWGSEFQSEPRRAATTPSLAAPAPEPPAVPEREPPSEPPEIGGAAEDNEVWRRLARGDREGVLVFLQSARADGDTRSADRLAYDVLAAVNASLVPSRATARITPGAASSEPYRLAEERLGSANRLEAARDPIGALGLLWEASDLYVRSLNGGPGNPAAPPAKPESRTSVESAAPTPPPALPSSRASLQSLPPESLPLTGTATAAADRLSTGRRRTATDVDGVLEALDRYRSAYQARDVSQVLLVFPSLSTAQVEQIRRTFDGVAGYDVELRDTRVDVQAEVATAGAVVVRRITPLVGNGNEVSNEVETTFRLRRTGAGWVITDVTAQTAQ
jgi:hypothetical protein